MKLPTEKQKRWEIDDKIFPYLRENDQLKEDAPDWARELYGDWKKRLQEMREEMIEEKKRMVALNFKNTR
jgi:hypothetical protein